jgi:hypothetical protein
VHGTGSVAQVGIYRGRVAVHHSEHLVLAAARSGYAVQSLDCSAQSQASYQN